ncbi:hypothetical protein [Salidesulfovibrio onnuriiensis]|uniref:hypothetical protein n=1 Tax=Salidesulfovibrio onnuriiensis TaxID=2583823 RepID=UPI0011CADD7C|nr:hypothetical protein [Salidesulfovibrio onnuriiensis]
MLQSKNWKEWIAVLLLFGTGALVGAGIMRLYMDRFPPPPIPAPEELKDRIIGRLDTELNLTSEQYEAITEIFEEGFRRSMEIRKPIDKQMDELLDEQYRRIMALLTPEQQEKFKVLHERFEKRRKAFHRPGPPPPPPPLMD